MIEGNEGYTGDFFDNSDDTLGTGSKTALAGIFGGVVCGVSATPGVAGVVVCAPAILMGAAAGAGVYGSYAACKWGFRKIRNILTR